MKVVPTENRPIDGLRPISSLVKLLRLQRRLIDCYRNYQEYQMKKSKFSLAQHKDRFVELVKKTDHKTLAIWAIDCAERVMPNFEEKYPEDQRPRQAIETLQAWIKTGAFKMAVIRKASLTSHAAARDVGEDNAA